jgi:hypothetical protein
MSSVFYLFFLFAGKQTRGKYAVHILLGNKAKVALLIEVVAPKYFSLLLYLLISAHSMARDSFSKLKGTALATGLVNSP